MLIWKSSVVVSCVPNESKTAIQITAKNALIEDVVLKYNSGFLEAENEKNLFRITAEGMEYVRVYYSDTKNFQDYVDFEVVVSQYKNIRIISISKLNGLGLQVSFHTY